MNIGTVKPTFAEVVAFSERVITKTEERARRQPTRQAQDAWRDQYMPVSYEIFCKAVANIDRTVREMNREVDSWNDRQERLRRDQDRRQLDQERARLDKEAAELRAVKRRHEDDQAAHREEEKRNRKPFDDAWYVIGNEYETDREMARRRLADRQAELTDAQRAIDDRAARLKQAEDRVKQAAAQRQLAADLAPPAYSLEPLPGIERLIRFGRRRDFTPDPAGYLAYLRALAPGYSEAIDGLTSEKLLPETGREMHTLVVGPSKWGKSELLKQLVYHYVRHKSAGVLILDPHNDLAKQVTRWPELVGSDRLVFVDPELIPGMTVGINPLDGTGLDELKRQKLADVWARLLGEITDELTTHMERIFNHCMRVLLAYPGGATLFDLQLLISAPDFKHIRRTKAEPLDDLRVTASEIRRAGELYQFAKSYPDRYVRLFFSNSFDTEQYKTTRASLVSRIDTFLQKPHVSNMFVGRQTLDLQAALDAKKVVVVNLLPFGSNKWLIGRLFLGMVFNIGESRGAVEREKRVPLQLVVDEATRMISETMINILSEMRKFGIYSTLVQQVEGDRLPPSYREPLKINTGCKFYAQTTRNMVELLDVQEPLDDLERTQRGQFWLKWPDFDPPRIIQVHSNLADNKHAVSAATWAEYVASQAKSRLFRPWTEEPDLAVIPADPEPLGVDEPEPSPVLDSPHETADTVTASADPVPAKAPRPRATKAARPVSTRRKKADGPVRLFPALESEGDG